MLWQREYVMGVVKIVICKEGVPVGKDISYVKIVSGRGAIYLHPWRKIGVRCANHLCVEATSLWKRYITSLRKCWAHSNSAYEC